MFEVTENFITSIAPNEQAIKNGKDLVAKGKFIKYQKSKDLTLIMGECTGSGKDNYIVSADFINEGKPIFRCSCPSRQLPCKHVLGLLYAHLNGKKFSDCEIPEDIITKREKQEKREEKKTVDKEESPKKVNVGALVKKIRVQIEGLDLLDKLINEIVTNGLGMMNVKQERIYEEKAKKLGDYYLTGVQTKFRNFLNHFKDPEKIDYPSAILDLVTLNNLISKGKDYLTKKIEDPLNYIDKNSTIDELIGNTWQLSQLKELGLVRNDVRLIQLSFNCINEEASMQYVDEGIVFDLTDGSIFKTQNFRPYKATKYIKEEDSCFNALNIKELYIYPGCINQRVRFEESLLDNIKLDDYLEILKYAKTSYMEVVKNVKNIIKNPLAEREVYVLLKYKNLGIIDDQFVIENENNERIVLTGNCQNFYFINNIENSAVLGFFKQNYALGLLEFTPLSIITTKKVIRLAY